MAYCRDRAHRCRPLSMDAAQRHVPASLPLARRVPGRPLAPTSPRCHCHRNGLRSLLTGLLLDADGALVCFRANQPRPDRGGSTPRAAGKDDAVGRTDEPAGRCAARALGHRRPSPDLPRGRMSIPRGSRCRRHRASVSGCRSIASPSFSEVRGRGPLRRGDLARTFPVLRPLPILGRRQPAWRPPPGVKVRASSSAN
jgi:hypothetical protein